MKRLFVVFFLLLFVFAAAAAQSDDITLPGSVSPLYTLESPFKKQVTTSTDEILELEVSDIFVEKERILIRFYITGLRDEWKSKITDENRLYGSYLPVAEIVLDNGTILTPSSASKYSFLEYNNGLIVGGLLNFMTDQVPQAFYLNFNQIPFDTQPLSEGFTEAVILKTAGKNSSVSTTPSTTADKTIEFAITASAQTSELTMLQPSVRMLRSDEILSKFGWITISDAQTGKKYASVRGSLYGFNLSDDEVYSPAHAYVFSVQSDQTPLSISMDHAYIVREFEPAVDISLDLRSKEKQIIQLDEDFVITVSSIDSYPDEDRIRIYIDQASDQTTDPGAHPISDISFYIKDMTYVINPPVTCGYEADQNAFACDIFFNDTSFPVNVLNMEIDAVEYLSEGNWTYSWTPVPMEEVKNTDTDEIISNHIYEYQTTKEQPAEIQNLLDNLDQKYDSFTNTPGWILESYQLDYQFDDSAGRDLIPMDQFEQYHTNYISDTWYHINEKGDVFEIIMLVRDIEENEISSAQLQVNGYTIDLIHALKSQTRQPVAPAYQSFPEFRQVADSSALFVSAENCPSPDNGHICINYYHSLNGIPNSPNGQIIIFTFNEDNDFLLREEIDYNRGELKLVKSTAALEKRDALPEDVSDLIDSIR